MAVANSKTSFESEDMRLSSLLETIPVESEMLMLELTNLRFYLDHMSSLRR